MTTINRIIESEHDRTMAIRLLENRAAPFTLSLTDGKHRSTKQNRLQRQWLAEIAEQMAGTFESAEHVRGYCKLHFGVPILRDDNEAFRLRYDAVVKPMPYEQKLSIMMEPLSLPVTSIMTTKQKTAYLDAIWKHFSEQGVVLTNPEAFGLDDSSSTTETAPGDRTADPDETGEPAGEATDGPAAAGSPVDPSVKMLMQECIENMLRDAFSEPKDQQAAKVEKLRDVFLEPQNLGGHPKFVELCAETVRRIIGKPDERARAKEYLLGRIPA